MCCLIQDYTAQDFLARADIRGWRSTPNLASLMKLVDGLPDRPFAQLQTDRNVEAARYSQENIAPDSSGRYSSDGNSPERSSGLMPRHENPHRNLLHWLASPNGDSSDPTPAALFGQLPDEIPPPHAPSDHSSVVVPPPPPPPPTSPVSSTAMYEQNGADGKIRPFVCPVSSCGRAFKRIEHVKRHLRTHTTERPFTCPRCKKRFSRSENLKQHLRTHDRYRTTDLPKGNASSLSTGTLEGENGKATTSDSGNAGQWAGGMDNESERLSMHNGDSDGVESGDEDWTRYTSLSGVNYQALGLSRMVLSSLGIAGNNPDGAEVRELDASDVQEVQGEEEGLLMVVKHGSLRP
ncbi:hypothetical protein NMY22_g515 [Coprinellus aureogranulatus]|nr:hypothetical protein NMY22_g515 [Coprinellus aureogranulatus]